MIKWVVCLVLKYETNNKDDNDIVFTDNRDNDYDYEINVREDEIDGEVCKESILQSHHESQESTYDQAHKRGSEHKNECFIHINTCHFRFSDS